MRIWIASVGARARDAFEELAEMYVGRMRPLLPGGKSAVEAPVFRSEQALREAVEKERARAAPLLVLLDERGKQMESEAFAEWLGREMDGGRQLIVFAVGPADGWGTARGAGGTGRGGSKAEGPGSSEDMRLSLGKMTMAHELARVVLCEQVYRALTILKGHPYHRGWR